MWRHFAKFRKLGGDFALYISKTVSRTKNITQGASMLHDLCLPVKFRPYRFRFAGVIPQKGICLRRITVDKRHYR